MSQSQVSTAPPAIVALNGNIIYLLLGLYGWEYVQSLDIEYGVIRGRLCFRLPLIPYVVGRTCLLTFLILLAVETSPFSSATLCEPSMLLTSLLGEIALGCSSTIFMIRTWIVWKDTRLVQVLLLLLSLGQFALLVFDTAGVKSINVNGICEVYINYPQANAATLIYTTCYDLLVSVLMVVGLSRQRSESPLKTRLRAQGILYFALTVIVYIPPTVFALLNVSSLLVLFSNTAITASTIASSRAVRSLLSLDTSESGQTPESNVAFTTQIAIRSSTTREGTIAGGQLYGDEADKC